MPNIPQPTPESRCKAAEIRTQRLAQEVQDLEEQLAAAQDRLAAANDKITQYKTHPPKPPGRPRESQTQREKNDAAALTRMFAESAGVIELAACHIVDLATQLTILGGDPTPADVFTEQLPDADGSPTATAARRFIADRVEQAPQPKRRVRRAPKESTNV